MLLVYNYSHGGIPHDNLISKPINRWTVDDVTLWIEQLGAWTNPYRETFFKEQVNGRSGRKLLLFTFLFIMSSTLGTVENGFMCVRVCVYCVTTCSCAVNNLYNGCKSKSNKLPAFSLMHKLICLYERYEKYPCLGHKFNAAADLEEQVTELCLEYIQRLALIDSDRIEAIKIIAVAKIQHFFPECSHHTVQSKKK